MTDCEPLAIRASDERDNDTVHQLLRAYNRRFMRDFHAYNFHIMDKDTLVAGIVAAGVFDTLEVEFLYVAEDMRGRGLGSRLLAHVEDAARKDGLRRVLLNTYSFQAPGFYEKHGYQRLFAVSPCFAEYRQYYYVKTL